MLRNEILDNSLYQEMTSFIEPMGFKVVDVIRNETAGGVLMYLTVFSPEREVTTDDLAAVYNIVYPRYQVLLNTRDLTLEVSSPGLQRNFKDYYEFTLFTGKMVRIYSERFSSNLEGRIKECKDGTVTLTDVIIQDTNEKMDELSLAFEDIQKAKLTYRWEEKK